METDLEFSKHFQAYSFKSYYVVWKLVVGEIVFSNRAQV